MSFEDYENDKWDATPLWKKAAIWAICIPFAIMTLVGMVAFPIVRMIKRVVA